jgi:hypothetical protein
MFCAFNGWTHQALCEMPLRPRVYPNGSSQTRSVVNALRRNTTPWGISRGGDEESQDFRIFYHFNSKCTPRLYTYSLSRLGQVSADWAGDCAAGPGFVINMGYNQITLTLSVILPRRAWIIRALIDKNITIYLNRVANCLHEVIRPADICHTVHVKQYEHNSSIL